MREKIAELLGKIKQTKENASAADNKLPSNAYYMENGILCTEDTKSDIRYPYDYDGMNLWIHSSGHIDACEGMNIIIRPVFFNSSPLTGFWCGVKVNDNKWFPISVSDAAKQLYEPFDVERYVVFEKRAAYFIADCEKLTFAVRANITTSKQIAFTLCVVNKSTEASEIYISSLIEFMLRDSEFIHVWDLITRFGKITEDGSYKIWTGREDKSFVIAKKEIFSQNKAEVLSTISKMSFTGGASRSAVNALSLKNGRFEKEVRAVNTTDVPVIGDIIKVKINSGEEIRVTYLSSFTNDAKKAENIIVQKTDFSQIEEDILLQEKTETESLSRLSTQFGDFSLGTLNKNVFNRFLENVQKQVDLCAMGKNYVGQLVGIRDIFQQLDTSVFWNPEGTKEKIVLSLNYIFSNGRTPRQYEANHAQDVLPYMDIREFIDQGLWIINTVYNYISVTGDYTILKRKCSYYDMVDEEKRVWQKGETTDVFDHLLRITEYLILNIDKETGCLKINYGDWNDSLNALGKTKDEEKKYGTGVSVMATLQLYKNLEQMTEICMKIGGTEAQCKKYASMRKNIKNGLLKHALMKTENGENHIIHGWGDKKGYGICTPDDFDAVRRYSSTVYSFWCICGMIEETPELKNDIMAAYNVLDSRFGIRTFFPHFEENAKEYIGGLSNITPGTYENCCAYLHSTMFSIMAMFILGESEKAWEQIEKAIPITHEFTSKTPFVMPNSWCENGEYSLCGESLGDWYTGSGCVFLRNVIRDIFGIRADLDGVTVSVPLFMPTRFAKICVNLKNANLTLKYSKNGSGERKYFINGEEWKTDIGIISKTPYVYIENEKLSGQVIIEVTD